MQRVVLLGMVVVLAGCGGSPQRSASSIARSAPVASGPISRACLQSNRETRSPRLCGCVQAAANQTLSQAQQRRAVAFYTDPHLAQVIRQSDRAVDKRFWEAYVAYGERAEQLCSERGVTR